MLPSEITILPKIKLIDTVNDFDKCLKTNTLTVKHLAYKVSWSWIFLIRYSQLKYVR